MVLLAQMPKRNKPPKAEVEIFITRSCLGAVPGKEGMQHLEIGSRVKVSEETARQIVWWAGSAYYVSAEDDDSESKSFTLTVDAKKAAECEKRLRDARVAESEEERAYAQASRRALIEKYGTGRA